MTLCRYCQTDVRYDSDTNRWIDVAREMPHICTKLFKPASELGASVKDGLEKRYPHLYYNDARELWFCKRCEFGGPWKMMEKHKHKKEKKIEVKPGQNRLF